MRILPRPFAAQKGRASTRAVDFMISAKFPRWIRRNLPMGVPGQFWNDDGE